MIVILFLYTFGENLEILVYLYWPGMVIMGMALQERKVQTHAEPSLSSEAGSGPEGRSAFDATPHGL